MYEFNTTLALPFDQAVEKVRAALMAEHLGVVSEVDVQAILRNKIGREIPAYRIFGACNPGLAARVIDSEPNAGVLLPCNFVVREIDAENTQVSFMDPVPVLALTSTEAPKAVAAEAKEILDRVVARLGD